MDVYGFVFGTERPKVLIPFLTLYLGDNTYFTAFKDHDPTWQAERLAVK